MENKSNLPPCKIDVESVVDNAIDFAVIDAAAKAWVEAGGDADGITYLWQNLRERVRELK